MNLDKPLLKTIRLYPTLFEVDIWLCNNLDNLSKAFNNRYGASIEYYKEETYQNQCGTIDSKDNSELKGRKQIVINLDEFNITVLYHELIHVLYHLSKITHLETTYDAQEWIAYFNEYLGTEALKIKDYKEYIILKETDQTLFKQDSKGGFIPA